MTGAGRGAPPSGCSRAGASPPVSPAVIDLTAAGSSGASQELRSIFHAGAPSDERDGDKFTGKRAETRPDREGRAKCRKAVPRPGRRRSSLSRNVQGEQFISSAQVLRPLLRPNTAGVWVWKKRCADFPLLRHWLRSYCKQI